MYVRIGYTLVKVKGTMEQEEISIEKIRKLIRTLEWGNGVRDVWYTKTRRVNELDEM